MNFTKPLVSVIVPTFNHEKYIVRALESIRMQIVDFPIEVLVGEDCSTDNTRAILKKYERKHPEFCTIFYRRINMNKMEIRNGTDLRNRISGKYYITLEGDDYWTDKYKLQKQVDFLEENPDYIAVAHNCIVVDENSKPTGELYPECKDNEYTMRHFLKGVLPGQLTTILKRNIEYDRELTNKGGYNNQYGVNIPGDRLQVFTLLFYGKIYCIQECMSAYRHVLTGSSWSANNRNFPIKASLLMYKWYSEYAEKRNRQYYILSRIAYLSAFKVAIKNADASLLDLLSAFIQSKKRINILLTYITQKICPSKVKNIGTLK